jgi:ArsR family transcriptional regulator, arsenate/arsenite/antimonite-responsive transcriptional repressor
MGQKLWERIAMRTLSSVFKALSDETRLQMLGLLLREGELCVCDFVEVLEITQSKASRHLRHLVKVGLLDDRREAVWVYFRLADSPGFTQAEVISMLPTVLIDRVPEELFERLEEWIQRKERTEGSCKARLVDLDRPS